MAHKTLVISRKILMMKGKDRKSYMYLKFYINPTHIVYVINCILTHTFIYFHEYITFQRLRRKPTYKQADKQTYRYTDRQPRKINVHPTYRSGHTKQGPENITNFEKVGLKNQNICHRNGISCPEVYPVGMPHPSQLYHGNISYSVKRLKLSSVDDTKISIKAMRLFIV